MVTSGKCPPISTPLNCQPVFVHSRNDALIESVLRMKREAVSVRRHAP